MSSAGSSCSDLYCPAVEDACQQLVKRLAPFRSKDGKPVGWKQAVKVHGPLSGAQS